MVQKGQITLYNNGNSPFGHRVEIALAQAKAEYTSYIINLADKPAWYAEKVNPVGKIPAITYGGPKCSPEDPSPESAKINESLVILEFLADLFPEAGLLPSDPVARAQARLFVAATDGPLFEGFRAFFFQYAEGSDQTLLKAFQMIQGRLPPTGFAIGEWSNADIATAPMLVRIRLLLKHDMGKYPVGEGVKLFEILQGPKFARLTKYIDDVQQWPTFKSTWDEAKSIESWKKNPYLMRNAQPPQ
ncbi:hypothetical protein NUW54_g7778 [Trametes sanguinea]|uniref:Uncharacterized protein n=1 Tax=Trametes sanguinea TaxID=158606 RepID=A0ACC1PJX6_9APHY|nr:hypothetical protein NUW54_g7778 [Trametes sanguinea]